MGAWAGRSSGPNPSIGCSVGQRELKIGGDDAQGDAHPLACRGGRGIVRPSDVSAQAAVHGKVLDTLSGDPISLRRDRRFGVFIDAPTMERTVVPPLGDVLRRSVGMTITPLGRAYSTRSFPASHIDTGGGGACLPAVFVDRTLVRRRGLQVSMDRYLYSLDYFAPPPSQVAGMEFYHGVSTVPVDYAGANAACYVVLIWSRR